jgi:WD40 repeat protein
MKYQPVDLIGGFYTDDAKLWAAQDTVNWLPVMAEVAGTRTPSKLRTPPGLRPWVQIGLGPVRGSINVEGKLFVVSGNELYRVATDGSGTLIGTIPGVGPVSMAYNQRGQGNELLVVNGDAGYVYNTSEDTFTKITDEGYPGAVQAAYLDSFLVQVEPFGRFWFHSDLADALNYNTLDRYESEASPDKIVGLAVNQFEVVVFNETTTEFFANVGAATGTFQSKRIVIDKGCAARHSIANIDNSVMWLGNDGVVYRLDGYRAVPVSTRAIERAIAESDWDSAISYVWEDEGHKVYYLTFLNGQTWGYDVVTGLWHRRASYSVDPDNQKRWRVSAITYWNSQWIAGDAYHGGLYVMDWNCYSEGSDPMVSERSSGVAHANQNRVFAPYAELIFDTGVGVPCEAQGFLLSLEGDLPDGNVGSSGTYQYQAIGGSPPYTFSIIAGSLPPGASMSAAGLVTYDYTTEGNYSWTVQAMDADGRTATLDDTADITVVVINELVVVGNTTGESDTVRTVTWDGAGATDNRLLTDQTFFEDFPDMRVSIDGKHVFVAADDATSGNILVAEDVGGTWTKLDYTNPVNMVDPPEFVFNGGDAYFNPSSNYAMTSIAVYELTPTPGETNWLVIWDGEAETPPAEFPDPFTRSFQHQFPSGFITSMKYSPDGLSLAVVGRMSDWDGVDGAGLVVISNSGGTWSQSFIDTDSSLLAGSGARAVAWASDGTFFIVLDDNSTIHVYTTSGGIAKAQSFTEAGSAWWVGLTISASGTIYCASSDISNDLYVYTWDGSALSAASKHQLFSPGTENAIYLSVSENEQFLLATSDGESVNTFSTADLSQISDAIPNGQMACFASGSSA